MDYRLLRCHFWFTQRNILHRKEIEERIIIYSQEIEAPIIFQQANAFHNEW